MKCVADMRGCGHEVRMGVWVTYCRECPGVRRCGGGEGLALCMPGVSAGVGRGLDRRCGLPSLH